MVTYNTILMTLCLILITHMFRYTPTLVYPFVSLRFSCRLALLGPLYHVV